MIYVYDILLNWNNANTLYEFYEWEQQDNLEHIKKIPLFKVDTEVLSQFLTNEITLDIEFLAKIKNATELYKNKRILYATLFTDGMRAIAMLFNEKGRSLFKSHLLLDEEEDVLSISKKLKKTEFSYECGKKYGVDPFLTRNDQLMKNFLKREFHSCYTSHNREKLRYMYMEFFDKKPEEDDTKMYEELKNSLQEITNRHQNLYELLKLSYTKMK